MTITSSEKKKTSFYYGKEYHNVPENYIIQAEISYSGRKEAAIKLLRKQVKENEYEVWYRLADWLFIHNILWKLQNDWMFGGPEKQ